MRKLTLFIWLATQILLVNNSFAQTNTITSFDEFMNLANKSKLLSGVTLLKLKMLSAIFSNDNAVFRKIYLKGLASKILMPKV